MTRYPRVAPLALLAFLVAACAPLSPGDGPAPVDEAISLVLRGPLFQSRTGAVLSDGVVVVRGDRVHCSGSADGCAYPEDAAVHRVRDGMILPGLIDLHVHARPHYVGAFVPSGVTTIRDASNNLAVVDSLRTLDGAPRVVASGPLIDGPESMMRQMSTTAGALGDYPLDVLIPVLVADGPAAARAVDALADAGVDFVKLYQTLSPSAFHGAVEAAHRRGLPVAVDIGMVFSGALQASRVDIVEAAAAGVTSIEHLSGLALAYQRRGGDPLSRPYDAEILDAIADEILVSQVTAVPTLATFMQFNDPDALPWREAPADHLERLFTARWQAMGAAALAVPEAVTADLKLTRALLRRLHDGDMLIGAGSDSPAAPHMVPGGGLHLELVALVRAGLTPSEALQAATWNAAQIMGRQDVGHLGPGARADIVIVDGDPARDIDATRLIRRVWFNGAEVDLEAAWAAMDQAPRRVRPGVD